MKDSKKERRKSRLKKKERKWRNRKKEDTWKNINNDIYIYISQESHGVKKRGSVAILAQAVAMLVKHLLYPFRFQLYSLHGIGLGSRSDP